jgi:DNA-binding transcriptional regulator GbsR (MarR family)
MARADAARKAKETEASAAEIKRKLYASFANVAALMGYSEVHGRIIAALTANSEPMSLADLAKESGYSLSSISTSLDFLEVLGMARRVKVAGDRRVYVQLDGDLLEGLKRAIVMKGKKGVDHAFSEFTKYEEALAALEPNDPEREKISNILGALRGELERLQLYLDLLGEIQLPREPPVRR